MSETEYTVMAAESRVSDFIALLKPRVMSLVVFTGAIGMLVAPTHPHPVLALVALFALAVGAGASGAVNMWFDRDIDAVMTRTQTRPLPAGKMHSAEALGFAVTLCLLSVMLMGFAANWLAAGLLAFAILFYAVFYTMVLKRHTPQNIVIGGAAGAFPPLIGWAAMTGNVTAAPVVLFLIIFLWTPPHFWALSLFACKDYAKAGVPMLPVVAGTRSTKWQMMVYTVLLVPFTLAPYWLLPMNKAYVFIVVALNALFVVSNVRVLQAGDENLKPARLMFGYSIFYLFAVFAALYLCHAPITAS